MDRVLFVPHGGTPLTIFIAHGGDTAAVDLALSAIVVGKVR